VAGAGSQCTTEAGAAPAGRGPACAHARPPAPQRAHHEAGVDRPAVARAERRQQDLVEVVAVRADADFLFGLRVSGRTGAPGWVGRDCRDCRVAWGPRTRARGARPGPLPAGGGRGRLPAAAMAARARVGGQAAGRAHAGARAAQRTFQSTPAAVAASAIVPTGDASPSSFDIYRSGKPAFRSTGSRGRENVSRPARAGARRPGRRRVGARTAAGGRQPALRGRHGLPRPAPAPRCEATARRARGRPLPAPRAPRPPPHPTCCRTGSARRRAPTSWSRPSAASAASPAWPPPAAPAWPTTFARSAPRPAPSGTGGAAPGAICGPRRSPGKTRAGVWWVRKARGARGAAYGGCGGGGMRPRRTGAAPSRRLPAARRCECRRPPPAARPPRTAPCHPPAPPRPAPPSLTGPGRRLGSEPAHTFAYGAQTGRWRPWQSARPEGARHN
jgi:hypothetical protein